MNPNNGKSTQTKLTVWFQQKTLPRPINNKGPTRISEAFGFTISEITEQKNPNEWKCFQNLSTFSVIDWVLF